MKKTLFATLALSALAAALPAQAKQEIELLMNADGSTLDGWTNEIVTAGREWTVISDGENSWIAASHGSCYLSQTVVLADRGVTEGMIQSRPTVTASGIVLADKVKNGKGSRFCRVFVYQYGSNGELLDTQTIMDRSGDVINPAEPFSGSFQLLPDARSLKFQLHGQDALEWSGFYGPRFRACSLSLVVYGATFVSDGETVGETDFVDLVNGTVPVPTRVGDWSFLGYFTEDGVQVFGADGNVFAGSLPSLESDVTLYAKWGPPEGSIAQLVYRGQLNLLSGGPATNATTYEKTMHFRLYDGSEATTPLWQTAPRGLSVWVNADGSFVRSFGDESLAALLATGTVTHVGLAIGESADTAVELKPRRELRPVAAVNRALTAEGAALDVRIGNLVTENAVVAADATVSALEVAGTVTAPGAGKVEVTPLVVGPDERTRLLRGKGVKAFSDAKPQTLATVKPALRGQVLATAPSDGIALVSSGDYGRRSLRCPAVVQYCRKGDGVRAPTSDDGGLKVTFFPFMGK